MIVTILLVAAFICFIAAAIKFDHPRIDAVALGLALWVLAVIIPR